MKKYNQITVIDIKSIRSEFNAISKKLIFSVD